MSMMIGGDGADGAAMDGLIIDGTDHSFMQDVVEESRARPVIVDFWAPWCGPCRTLGPALEKAVRAAKGAVRLVKINIDENPHVARQLQVQSIPAVFAIKDGRPVDGFAGALPDSQIKQFIDRLTGDSGAHDAAMAVAEGDKALEAGDAAGAAQFYVTALQMDPENAPALAGLARCYLAGGDAERARELLDTVPEEMRGHAAIQGALTALKYAETDADPSEIETLRKAADAAPDDHQTRLDLARALSARGRFGEAMMHLLDSIAHDRDWNEGAARAELLSLFEAAGQTSEATKSGRRRLSAILFS